VTTPQTHLDAPRTPATTALPSTTASRVNPAQPDDQAAPGDTWRTALITVVADAEREFWELIDGVVSGRVLHRDVLTALTTWLEQRAWEGVRAYEQLIADLVVAPPAAQRSSAAARTHDITPPPAPTLSLGDAA